MKILSLVVLVSGSGLLAQKALSAAIPISATRSVIAVANVTGEGNHVPDYQQSNASPDKSGYGPASLSAGATDVLNNDYAPAFGGYGWLDIGIGQTSDIQPNSVSATFTGGGFIDHSRGDFVSKATGDSSLLYKFSLSEPHLFTLSGTMGFTPLAYPDASAGASVIAGLTGSTGFFTGLGVYGGPGDNVSGLLPPGEYDLLIAAQWGLSGNNPGRIERDNTGFTSSFQLTLTSVPDTGAPLGLGLIPIGLMLSHFSRRFHGTVNVH